MKKPYTGILAEHLPNWTAVTMPTDQELNGIFDERMGALFQHYGVDPMTPDGWAKLALVLAQAHVPAFQKAPRGRGRPKDRKDDVELFAEFRRLIRAQHSVDRAAQLIEKQDRFSGKWRTLKDRYNTMLRDKHWGVLADHLILAEGIGVHLEVDKADG